ncbi:MAG: RNA methyltransferase [Betaproteobacteria bacterium]|nr:MAG: RNA methyltransferase [Betaproteobacteria bacterium]
MNPIYPLKNIRIVLCGTAHPGNIGAAARAMRTMGITDLVLVNPQQYPDPQVLWLAAGAVDVLAAARVCGSLNEALSGVALAVACSARRRDVAVPMVDVRAAAAQAVVVARQRPVALVFGNETSGLSNDEVGACGLLASIPVAEDFSSLNVAAAVQVFCYELRMACGAALPPEKTQTLATHDEVEAFFAHLERTLIATGFLNPAHPRKLMYRLRRMFARTRLQVEEVNILRGILSSLTTPKNRNKS